MQEDAKSYLARKATQLGLDRAEALVGVQGVLDAHYKAQTRAKSLHNGVLKVATESAAVASELRLNQINLIKEILEKIPPTYQITRLHIVITDF